MPIFGVRKFTLNQYLGFANYNVDKNSMFGIQKFSLNQRLGSVNYNMDKNSIFGVQKSEERKNRGICLALTSHGMQCDPEVANHEINVLVSLKNLYPGYQSLKI